MYARKAISPLGFAVAPFTGGNRGILLQMNEIGKLERLENGQEQRRFCRGGGRGIL